MPVKWWLKIRCWLGGHRWTFWWRDDGDVRRSCRICGKQQRKADPYPGTLHDVPGAAAEWPQRGPR